MRQARNNDGGKGKRGGEEIKGGSKHKSLLDLMRQR